jgi:hypothetical protein
MKIWERFSAWLAPRTFVAEPVCVRDGNLRAYIWPTKKQFSYEVVSACGEKLWVGAASDLNDARARALRRMSEFLRQP